MVATMPTIGKLILGAELRALREYRKYTLVEAAQAANMSKTKLSRWETGEWVRGAPLDEMLPLLRLYQADQSARDRIVELLREAQFQGGWWEGYSFRGNFPAFEAQASEICTYEPEFVPGLLQSPLYVNHLVDHAALEPMDDGAADARREMRSKRQTILTRDEPPVISVVFESTALERLDRPVLVDQTRHIIDGMDAEVAVPVKVQVVPPTAGIHPALGNGFTIMDFRRDSYEMSILYCEGGAYPEYVNDVERVEEFRARFAAAQRVALSPRDTRRYLSRLTA